MSEHETHRANSQSEEFHYSMLKCVQVFRKRPHVHHFVERGEVRLESVHGSTINLGYKGRVNEDLLCRRSDGDER